MVFLAWVAGTGALLALDELTQPAQILFGPNANAALPGAAEQEANNSGSLANAMPLSQADISRWMAASIQSALTLSSSPTLPDIQLQLRMQDDQPQGTVTWGGADGRTVLVNAATGSVVMSSVKTPTSPAVDSYTMWRNRVHFVLKDLHSGAIIGLPGRLIDLLSGLAFVVLSVTGIVMYLDMLKARRKVGRKDLFWGSPRHSAAAVGAAMRSVHRWTATLGAVLLVYVSVSGTALQIDELAGGMPKPPPGAAAFTVGASAPNAATLLRTADVERRIDTALLAALHAAPNAMPTNVSIELRMVEAKPQGSVTLSGATRHIFTVDADTGAVLPTPPPPAVNAPGATMKLPFWAILQDLHSIAVIGPVGYWLDMLAGLSFVTLAVTGIAMYFSMLSARRKNGRKNILWG